MGTALLDPRPEPASAVYGSGASITTVARVTSDQAWTLQVTRGLSRHRRADPDRDGVDRPCR